MPSFVFVLSFSAWTNCQAVLQFVVTNCLYAHQNVIVVSIYLVASQHQNIPPPPPRELTNSSPIQSICYHYSGVIMGTMAYQITTLASVYSIVYSGADQRKHQSSASLAFVRDIHQWPGNAPHKGPVTQKMFQFDDVIMFSVYLPTLLTAILYIPSNMHMRFIVFCCG